MLQAREATYNQEQQRYASVGRPLERSYSYGRAKSPSSKHTLPRRKKHRVVLHTSPFIRCVQTSVAIAAGISQYRGLQDEEQSTSTQPKSALRSHASRASTAGKSSLQPIKDDEDDLSQQASTEDATKHLSKLMMRVDAFLGEWLTPEYYESITHPPDSRLMLAGAKSELLRRGDYVESPVPRTELKEGYSPGMWKSPDLPARSGNELALDGLSDLSSKSSTRTHVRDRAATQGSMLSTGKAQNLGSNTVSGGYVPPTPRYAISPSDPIPKGYIAHARDACVEVDYQWDSSRSPPSWGDGGSYGEEWSSMHKRFRNGIQHMVHWYRIHEASALRQTGHPRHLHPAHHEEYDSEDTDTVLVLVTHGSGCNALIGALTDQPVLLDVGMASLTMAVWKERPEDPASESYTSSLSHERSTSNPDVPLSAEYKVVITASVEHLRSDSTPLTIPLLQRPNLQLQADFLSPPRLKQRRTFSNPHPKYRLSNSSIVTTSPIDAPTELTSTWRSSSHQGSASAATRPSASSGLWEPPKPYVHPDSVLAHAETARVETKATAAVADGGNQPPPPPPPTRETTSKEGLPTIGSMAKEGGNESEAKDKEPDMPQGGEAEAGKAETEIGGDALWDAKPIVGQPGLWSPVRPEIKERMDGPKRRWTMSDQ